MIIIRILVKPGKDNGVLVLVYKTVLSGATVTKVYRNFSKEPKKSHSCTSDIFWEHFFIQSNKGLPYKLLRFTKEKEYQQHSRMKYFVKAASFLRTAEPTKL